MKYERPYKAEATIQPGYACAQGSNENAVIKATGSNDYLGPYEFENQRTDRIAGENLSIVLAGPAKILAKNATAGKKAIVDTDGTYINCPTTPGTYKIAGTFLESGTNEYVDIIVERSSVTIPA